MFPPFTSKIDLYLTSFIKIPFADAITKQESFLNDARRAQFNYHLFAPDFQR